ncbi:MAG: transposase [Planctomycetes bacterium]|nr:transposase [Planctomycetota bacterium]
MPFYRRKRLQGGTYFFTLVTAQRQPILTTDTARVMLRRCITEARQTRPFDVLAFVLLPDHLHTLWTLPDGDADYSTRWRHIKGAFTHHWLRSGGAERSVSPGQQRHHYRGVWQPRFYEHTIRDEDDLRAHVEYIHYNPVKHGLVACPKDWFWSSFHRYVADGIYSIDWCCGNEYPQPASVPTGNWLE